MYTVIFSEPGDYSTNDVIDWLLYLGQKVVRTDFNDLLKEFGLKISEQGNEYRFTIQNTTIESKNLQSLWYRRTVPFRMGKYMANGKASSAFETQVLENFFDELKYARNSFYNITRKTKKWLNDPYRAIVDKTECLFAAQSAGLAIPETIITNKKDELESFLEKNRYVIVKPIYNVSVVSINEYSYLQYTYRLDKRLLKKLPDIFFPSLAQRMVQKEFEIRTFFLEGKMNSMAMFTQDKSQTRTDFRRYDYIDPSRTVPYRLPSDIEAGLCKLMTGLGINCGSIDLIKGKDGQYYFLEVNPVGQFGMTSYPCNFYLEKEIAKFLSNG